MDPTGKETIMKGLFMASKRVFDEPLFWASKESNNFRAKVMSALSLSFEMFLRSSESDKSALTTEPSTLPLYSHL